MGVLGVGVTFVGGFPHLSVSLLDELCWEQASDVEGCHQADRVPVHRFPLQEDNAHHLQKVGLILQAVALRSPD